MRGFERAVEWLRSFVYSNAWDFCVVWKLGDDPSRFIEWKDCCCSGGINVKVEQDKLQLQGPPLCRDAQFQHSIRSKACEALSHFPFSVSLYAGENRIHGEVAISSQPKWLNHANISTSLSSEETMGTQVLIPVFGGLIELFASKNLLPIFLKMSKLKQPIGTYYGTKRLGCSQNVCAQQTEIGLVLDCKVNSVNDKMRTAKQPEKVNYHSKNLITERNRRKKIKDGLFKLRALVPKISKMDITAILTDAMEYIGNLQEEEKKLRNELKETEEGDCGKSNAELKSAKLDWLQRKNMSTIEENHIPSGISEMAKIEVHVEVNQITKREFWIKLCYKHKRSGFAKLMEGMDSLGLGVIDANITTFNGNVLNIFKVELILSVPLVQGKQGFRVQAIERLVDPPNKLDKQRYTV
ncbi:hypothetical protein GOBAR_DD31956 [Gossypium barbadense]|nr:hypothetical protein GOBAR_DD31956 [Gossypium barbadense]